MSADSESEFEEAQRLAREVVENQDRHPGAGYEAMRAAWPVVMYVAELEYDPAALRRSLRRLGWWTVWAGTVGLVVGAFVGAGLTLCAVRL